MIRSMYITEYAVYISLSVIVFVLDFEYVRNLFDNKALGQLYLRLMKFAGILFARRS